MWNITQTRSLNQPVLSNEGKVSCWRKQQEPWWSLNPQLTDYKSDKPQPLLYIDKWSLVVLMRGAFISGLYKKVAIWIFRFNFPIFLQLQWLMNIIFDYCRITNFCGQKVLWVSKQWNFRGLLNSPIQNV